MHTRQNDHQKELTLLCSNN